jgi:hypothetical protein
MHLVMKCDRQHFRSAVQSAPKAKRLLFIVLNFFYYLLIEKDY